MPEGGEGAPINPNVASEVKSRPLLDEVIKLENHPKLKPFTEKIPPELLEKITQNGSSGDSSSFTKITLEGNIEEFENDPATEQACQEIFLNDNHEFLRQKSTRQLKQLKDLYFSASSRMNIPGRMRLKHKADSFLEFVDSLRPVRADNTKGREEFKTPRELGRSSSFGCRDVVIQGDKYVYASFDEVPHHSAQGYDYYLDDDDIADRAQIVMQDCATLNADRDKVLKMYTDNVFDYRTGKQILAYYFASLFDNVDAAKSYIKINNGPGVIQNWDEFPPDFYTSAEWNMASPEQKDVVFQKIKVLHERTGIIPPLALEVRVPDRAKAIPRAA